MSDNDPKDGIFDDGEYTGRPLPAGPFFILGRKYFRPGMRPTLRVV